MAKKESLREYQDAILRKMETARNGDATQTQLFFGFRSAGKKFLIGAKDVGELAPPSMLEPIPVSRPWAVGAANIKGSVFSVTDFSILMGGDPIKKGKFLVLSPSVIAGSALLIEGLTSLYEQKDIGLAVHDPQMDTFPKWLVACHEIAGDRHYLVDAALLAADARFSKLQSGDTP